MDFLCVGQPLQYLLFRKLSFANRIDGTGPEHIHNVLRRELPGIESHWRRALSQMTSQVPEKAGAVLADWPHRSPLAKEQLACLGQTLHGPTQAFLDRREARHRDLKNSRNISG